MRPAEPGNRIKDAERRIHSVLGIGPEKGQNRVDRGATVFQVGTQRALFAKGVDAGVLV